MIDPQQLFRIEPPYQVNWRRAMWVALALIGVVIVGGGWMDGDASEWGHAVVGAPAQQEALP